MEDKTGGEDGRREGRFCPPGGRDKKHRRKNTTKTYVRWRGMNDHLWRSAENKDTRKQMGLTSLRV